MPSLENRVAKLEAELLKVRFDDLSDDQLRDYAYSLPFKSSRQYGALISLILRHGSALPIVYDDPDYQN